MTPSAVQLESDLALSMPWADLQACSFDFELPSELEAGQPPEARGLKRDQVRLMVSFYPSGRIAHTCFRSLADYLESGDVLVINTSGTLNAALNVTRSDEAPFELHFSTRLPGDLWVVELRQPGPDASVPYFSARSGELYNLPAGGRLELLLPYRSDQRHLADGIRLWIAALELPGELDDYLERFGFPIRYKYVRQSWPSEYYQTVYATQKGSAEMPSAGRAFTPELITRLVSQGIQIAPVLLHTGVASLEDGEPPYSEYFCVTSGTAQIVNLARSLGKHIIAVGTTSVRALESVTDSHGHAHPGEGWTDLVITPQRGLRAVDGLLTGFHEPGSSHLSMLAALAGLDHIQECYRSALQGKYLWHEFGDLHLILPDIGR